MRDVFVEIYPNPNNDKFVVEKIFLCLLRLQYLKNFVFL